MNSPLISQIISTYLLSHYPISIAFNKHIPNNIILKYHLSHYISIQHLIANHIPNIFTVNATVAVRAEVLKKLLSAALQSKAAEVATCNEQPASCR